ncbi:MAG: hypothetical protein KAJ42_10600 [Gemmatimonadetes bacterium]|nr:hypothetical protein [Gemmatimonadota bacterium]
MSDNGVDEEGLDQRAIVEQDMDLLQVAVAQELFEWWWRVSNDGRYSPRWEKCEDHIQAFWMDGAWRTLRVEI